MPTISPYASSNYTGFPELEDSGAQVSPQLTNTVSLGSHINWTQLLGISRQKVYSNFDRSVQRIRCGHHHARRQLLSRAIELVDFAQNNSESITSYLGPHTAFVDDGYFENRISPSSDLIWSARQAHRHRWRQLQLRSIEYPQPR